MESSQNRQYSLEQPVSGTKWNMGVCCVSWCTGTVFPAIPTSTEWILNIRNKESKRCFGISRTGPKPVQPWRFAVSPVESPISGFLSLFSNFWFFRKTKQDKTLVPGSTDRTGRSGSVFKTIKYTSPSTPKLSKYP